MTDFARRATNTISSTDVVCDHLVDDFAVFTGNALHNGLRHGLSAVASPGSADKGSLRANGS